MNYSPDFVRQVLAALAERRSVRTFSAQDVSNETIDAIISDGLEAPSSCNHQMWHFIVIKDQATRAELQKISGSNSHFVSCSAMIIITFQKGWDHNKFSVVQSTAAAAYHMSLSAHLRGLGVVWNAGIGSKERVGELINLPKQFEIIGALCIGYPAGNAPQQKPPRRPLSSVRSYEKFVRPEEDSYPLKKSKQYPYFKLLNHKSKFSEYNPKKWGWSRISSFRGLSVFAKSPLSGIYLSRRFKIEMLSEINALGSLSVGHKLLEIMPYGGSYTFQLLKKFPFVRLDLAELSELNFGFIKERIKQEGLESNYGTSVMDGGHLAYPDGYFDSIFAPQIIESVPDQKLLILELFRVLKPGGQLVISIRNKWSWFGYYFMIRGSREQVPNFGPYLPQSPLKVVRLLRKFGSIVKSFGVSPLPSLAGKELYGVRRLFCRLFVVVIKKPI